MNITKSPAALARALGAAAMSLSFNACVMDEEPELGTVFDGAGLPGAAAGSASRHTYYKR